MSNQNQKTVEQVPVQQVETPVIEQQPVNNGQPQVVVVQQNEGFGGWLKKHWKGAVATVTGIGAAVTSAVVAYKKGKAAGIMQAPMPQQEDYSLNPNE